MSDSLLDSAKEKQKQLNEAIAMLDDIGWKVDWALDFCNFDSINEHLSPLSYAIADAREEIEEELESLDEKIEEFENNKELALAEFESNCELQHYID